MSDSAKRDRADVKVKFMINMVNIFDKDENICYNKTDTTVYKEGECGKGYV